MQLVTWVSRVVAHLKKKIDSADIVALVHNKNHATTSINEDLEIREIDFQNRESLKKAFAGIDTLFMSQVKLTLFLIE